MGKKYSEEKKQEVLAFAAEHGVAAASTKFGIANPTIYGWQGRTKRSKGEAPLPAEDFDLVMAQLKRHRNSINLIQDSMEKLQADLMEEKREFDRLKKLL